MDQIKIKNLEVYGNHGVFQEETKLGQKFLVSAILYTNIRQAGQTDELSKSIHYGDICAEIDRFLRRNTYKLIETAAEKLARHLLIHTDRLEKIQLEIKKPWAPIGLPLETVSVEILRGWNRAFIAFGSNLGDKESYLNRGIGKIKEREDCKVEKISNFLHTEPYGKTDQPSFLNGVLEMKTLMTPWELLDCLHKIEEEEGRERKVRWGPRTLDLDILFYGNEVIRTKELTIPHIDMANRDFVLAPMKEIAPYFCHPLSGKTIEEMFMERKGKK